MTSTLKNKNCGENYGPKNIMYQIKLTSNHPFLENKVFPCFLRFAHYHKKVNRTIVIVLNYFHKHRNDTKQ